MSYRIPIHELIVCQKCLGNLSRENNTAHCLQCGSSFVVKEDVYYFAAVDTSIIPSPAKPKEEWTKWRKLNFLYTKEKLHGLAPESKVLDVGAGPGQFKELFKNYRYTSMDFYPYEGIGAVSDITKQFPFRENVFDCVILSNVLEHLNEPQDTLRECYRVLKPKGRVIILVPFIIKVHQAPYDFLRYTNFMLEYLLSNSKFSDIEISEIGNIFDLQKSFVRGGFTVYIKNLRKNMPNRFFRMPLAFALLSTQRITLGILRLVRYFFDDTIDNKTVTNIPIGYGAVAKKPIYIKKNNAPSVYASKWSDM